MARYIRRALSALGSELWIGFEVDGVCGDLSEWGFIRAEELSVDELQALGVDRWIRIGDELDLPIN